jgi:hypothetical protein
MIYLTPLTTTMPEERRKRDLQKITQYIEKINPRSASPTTESSAPLLTTTTPRSGSPTTESSAQPLTTTTLRSGSPSHRINHHHAGKPKPPPNQPVSCFNRKPKRPKEQREKREQREERANEKKREKFSEEMRGEREKNWKK